MHAYLIKFIIYLWIFNFFAYKYVYIDASTHTYAYTQSRVLKSPKEGHSVYIFKRH